MKNKTTHFLSVSLILVSLFCIIIFVVQAMFMNVMGENTIRELGVIYMSGMSEEVAAHFGTTIELRLSQVKALADAVPAGRYAEGDKLQIELAYHARSMGFEYLAFYTEDGAFHMIYGPQVSADVPEALHRSVQGGKYNVCAGRDEEGTNVVLMGVPVVYPMGDGQESMAIVAGLPTSYLGDMLESSIKSDMMIRYSIIRNDGSYVLQNSVVEENNYFEHIEHRSEMYREKRSEQHARELREALEYDRDYTDEVILSDERWIVYCTNLPNSEWHLLLEVSHNKLDETVNNLQRIWSFASGGGCLLIIAALLLVFWGYFRLMKKQMRALDEAREVADQARKSAERSNRVKNEFLSNMSHDIRTPMNGIMGMTSVAINNLDNTPRVRSCLKRINASSRHLLGLINDMLDMSKIENDKLLLNKEILSLSDIMHNIVTVIQPQVEEKNQCFNVYVRNIYCENVCSDRVRLSQILLNIIGNAVKFTPENGVIEASLCEMPSPKGDAYIRSCLHIKDNGIGISDEFKDKIFDAFAREDNARVEKAAGAGMGLTITKYIVDAMGGTISVESERGKGSDFCVVLDMEIAAGQEQELRLPCREVLVIDDDGKAAESAVEALESIGLRAESASDMEQALQKMRERREKGGDYHMILLDWDIQGRDGIMIARDMRSAFGEDLPIILISDGEWDELEASAGRAGINAFLSKPLFRSGLYHTLQPFVEKNFQENGEKEEEIDLTGMRVLIAEDNELNWEIASEMLAEFGLETEWAENGKVCLEKFEQSESGWYDVILMDLRMPVMTGLEAAVAIRALNREDAGRIPIIAVSADGFWDDVQKCLDCGMNAHTVKPYNLAEIIGILQEYAPRKA